MKVTFLCTLWYLANLYSFDNTDSLVDFFDMVGVYRIGELEGFFVEFPFCIPLLYSSGASLLFFWSIYCFLPIYKKKKNEINTIWMYQMNACLMAVDEYIIISFVVLASFGKMAQPFIL